MVKVRVDLEKLRGLRAYKGITKRKLSRLMGYKTDAYTYLENGRVDFTIKRLNQVCQFLEIDPRDILIFEEISDETTSK